MKRSRKQQIGEKSPIGQKESCNGKLQKIYGSNMDPDMKAHYLNDYSISNTVLNKRLMI
jgi:hypothetical protein